PTKQVRVRYEAIIHAMLDWFLRLYAPPSSVNFVLDAAETALALVHPKLIESLPTTEQDTEGTTNDNEVVDWRSGSVLISWLETAETLLPRLPLSQEQTARLYQMLRWLDEPTPGVRRKRVSISVLFAAYTAGAATLA